MDKKMAVTLLGVVALAILAIIGKSAVMLVSAAATGIAVYVFRRARTRDRVIGIIAAALGGSIGAEIVHTVYHYSTVAEPGGGGDTGGNFMTSILIGVINAAAIIFIISCTEAAFRIIGRKSDQQGVEQ